MNAPRTIFGCRLPADQQRAWDWHARAAAFERLVPPFDPVRLVDSRGTIEEGDWKTIALPPFGLRWTAVHGKTDAPRSFVDEQARGPFARFAHVHRFVAIDASSCELRDEIDWRLPLEPLSSWAAPLVRRKLARAFAWRQHVVAHDLALHGRLDLPPLRIEIGGTSPAVAALRALLSTGGHDTGAGVRHSGQPAAAAADLDDHGTLRVARPGRDMVQFECGTVVATPRDLRKRGAWTAVEDLAEALLLAAAGRVATGTWRLERARALAADDDSPLELLHAGGVAIVSRWSSPADLHSRLTGRAMIAPLGS